MVKRKVVFRKKRQNRLGMFLVLTVVLMLLVVVSFKSVELKQKQETYAAKEKALQEQIDAENARTQEIEEYRKYTRPKSMWKRLPRISLDWSKKGKSYINRKIKLWNETAEGASACFRCLFVSGNFPENKSLHKQ